MFYNFNAHRAKKSDSKPAPAPAKRIFQKLLFLQRSWADFMDRSASRLSFGWLKALSASVLTVAAAYSLYLTADGLSAVSGFSSASEVHQIWPLDDFVEKQKVRQHSRLELYLDSLEKALIKDSLNLFKHH